MRVLHFASHITINGRSEFERNKTGFGYMVFDIAKSIAKYTSVDVMPYHCLTNACCIDGVSILKNSWGVFLRYLYNAIPISNFLSIAHKFGVKKHSLLLLFYAWFASGYYKHLIQKGNYDIVHIHGCGFTTELLMRVCNSCHQKFVVTLHGLNSFNDSIKIGPAGYAYERYFLKEVIACNISISVISSGIKRRILAEYNVTDCANIEVITNSFSFQNSDNFIDIRTKYGIPNDAKIILYVGNISENKNQKQLIQALPHVNKNLLVNTFILFVGNPSASVDLQKLIDETKMSDHCILCGGVDKTDISSYYQQGDGVVLLSYSDGFGLSLVEGMHFGLPCMTFTDMDAYNDIYNECAVIGIEYRSDESVAMGLEKLLSTSWNKQKIIEYSDKFKSDAMADNYCKWYKTISQQ